jgi:hypothetical protein
MDKNRLTRHAERSASGMKPRPLRAQAVATNMKARHRTAIQILCVVAIVLGCAWLFYHRYMRNPTSEEMLTRLFGAPLPEGVAFKREIYYFNPALGDGAMTVELEATPAGMERVLKQWDWTDPTPHDMSILRSRDLLEKEGQQEIYTMKINELTRVILLFKREEHTIIAVGAGI